ncbi:MAG TPA: hypothetical protein VGD10_08200 [Allosphingosinicella sp.]|uniref:hypothetical protein n=1 Tax=Allosphingosinicella sp. TaxID=2823234 RepID=UPI002EDABFCC
MTRFAILVLSINLLSCSESAPPSPAKSEVVAQVYGSHLNIEVAVADTPETGDLLPAMAASIQQIGNQLKAGSLAQAETLETASFHFRLTTKEPIATVDFDLQPLRALALGEGAATTFDAARDIQVTGDPKGDRLMRDECDVAAEDVKTSMLCLS